MRAVLLKTAVIAGLFFCMAAANTVATRQLFASQPPWYFLNLNSYKKMLHITGVSFGSRALLADIEYINFLQYYGNIENRKERFRKVFDYLVNITDADPHFTFAYTFGSAILAFNREEYDKALYLINKGLEYNPKIWQLRLYLGAILYKQGGKMDREKYVKFLEEALRFEDHPAMIERLLGNIYESYKDPDFSANYWAWVYNNTKDRDTRLWAYGRIMAIIKSGNLKDPSSINIR